MPQGGRLLLRTRHGNAGELCLEVADTGVGMTPEVRARAVEPFFTTRARGRGLGIGLAAAFGAARAHGGRLEIDTAPGAGTTVRLCFPPLPVSRSMVSPVDAAEALGESGPTSGPTP
jgi:signal transduction histidine kinase